MLNIQWKDLTIEQQSLSGLFEGKYIDAYNDFTNEHIFMAVGHDRHRYKYILKSISTGKTYMKYVISFESGELCTMEIATYLLLNKATAAQAAEYFELIQLED